MDILEIEKRVREDEAKSLEAYRKGQGEAPTLYRAQTFDISETKASDDDSAPKVFVASTEDVDRGGDVVRQSGWELANFKRNPVYQWAHNYGIPPLGIVPKIWVEGKSLLNTVKFDLKDPFAADISRKFDARILRAQSVGFRAIEFEERKSKGFFQDYEFTKQELLEISAVPIPMNQRALRKALEQAEAAPVYFFPAVKAGDDGTTTTSWAMTAEPNFNWTAQDSDLPANIIRAARELQLIPPAAVVEPGDDEEPDVEAKAGRTLSTKNFNRLKDAADAIADVLATATTTEEPEDDVPADEPDPNKAIESTDEPVEELEPTEEPGLSSEDAERIRRSLATVTEEI